jgi:hypothetical protein
LEQILSTSTNNGRKPRWDRVKNPERLVLQLRDRDILVVVYTYRFLTSEQVQELFGFGCTRRVNIRLRRLFDNGYLSRSFLSTTRGSGKALYFLGPQGTAVVARELGLDLTAVKNRMKCLSQLKEFFLCHALELNKVRISISQAVQSQAEMKLETWISDNDCEQPYDVIVGGKEILRRFRPDGYFRIWYHGKAYGFFLELDRSTESLSRFKSKVQTYLEFTRLGYYRRRFGLNGFRVLVIAPTRERMKNLKQAVEQVTQEGFRFTTMDQIMGNKVLGHIWQRAGHEGLFPLIRIETS